MVGFELREFMGVHLKKKARQQNSFEFVDRATFLRNTGQLVGDQIRLVLVRSELTEFLRRPAEQAAEKVQKADPSRTKVRSG